MLFKIPVNPYSVDLWVIISANPHKEVAQANVSNPGLQISWDDGMAAWTNDHFYNGCVLAVVFDSKYFDPNTVAHEAVHIKNMVFQHAGIKHDFKNDEPEAYLLGFIVGEIYRCHGEMKKKKK